jgi:hypothetical protein
LSGALATFVALAVPDEGGRVGVPARDGVVEPGDQLILGLGMLAVERSADDDPLDRLGQVQPGAANGGVQRHDAVMEQPADDGPTQVAGQIVPDQEKTERWEWIAGFVTQPGHPAGQWWALLLGHGEGWERGEHRGQLGLKPRVEHGVRRVRDAFRSHLARGRAEQGQQLDGPTPDVLVRLERRLPDGRPRPPGLRDRLVWPGLVLAPERQTGRLGYPVREVDGPLFSSVWGSTTCTTPDLRFRCAVPVGHQVRVRW